MLKQEYSVLIYPQGFEELPAALIFKTQAAKETYIKQEAKYCSKEYYGYQAADNKAERISTKNDLRKVRIRFAMVNNFTPTTKDKLKWVYRKPAQVVA